MTFPFLPHRSSSDDDELDQQLNEWATGSHTDPASDEAADALEFHRWADNTRRSDPAATGPAAGTWNRVLRNSAQANPKVRKKMSSAVLESQPAGYGRQSHETPGERAMHYSKLVATLALVLAVTMGGWFAMSQMPGGGDGRFAAIQGTPEVAQSQTCEVEPLTVDEVMAIVENPYSVAPFDSWGTPEPGSGQSSLAGEGLREHPNMFRLPENMSSIPDEEEFISITQLADQYLNCSFSGTVGQQMALVHPEIVQMYVLGNFPVYRDQADVRAFVESVIDVPAKQVTPAFNIYAEELWPTYQSTITTSERTRIRVADSRGGELLTDRTALVGTDFIDENGVVVGATDWDGTVLEGDFSTTNGGVSLILVYAEATDSWYFYGYNAPRG